MRPRQFDDTGDWSIALPIDTDLKHLESLEPVVQAIDAFAQRD